MSTAPRLTIGLPVYNGEKYVTESLEALLGQSFADFELIISDNASIDSSGDTCRRYEKQDSRVRYFRQPRNVGLARTIILSPSSRGANYSRIRTGKSVLLHDGVVRNPSRAGSRRRGRACTGGPENVENMRI